jgi:hypothetical protein
MRHFPISVRGSPVEDLKDPIRVYVADRQGRTRSHALIVKRSAAGVDIEVEEARRRWSISVGDAGSGASERSFEKLLVV